MHFSCHSSENNLAQPWVHSGIWNATASFNKQQKQVWMLMFEILHLKRQGISFFLLGCCLDTQLSTQKIFSKPQEENKSRSSFKGWKIKIARGIKFCNNIHLESCRQLHEDCRKVGGGDSVWLQILDTSQEGKGRPGVHELRLHVCPWLLRWTLCISWLSYFCFLHIF